MYKSTQVKSAAGSSQFHQKELSQAAVAHVLNDGATTTSTESTAQGFINQFVTTTTTDATQAGTGHGHTVTQYTTTTTTDVANPVTRVQHNLHTSTTDIESSTSVVPPATPGSELCGGEPLAIVLRESSADVLTKLCMHVKGSIQDGGFMLGPSTRPIIILACVANSPNQLFTWLPAEQGGMLRHDASGLLLSVDAGNVVDGSAVALMRPDSGYLGQQWLWSDPMSLGGTISTMADERFEITDSRVNQASNGGLPVHMWHLHKSMPTGMPNAAWSAECAANN